MDPNQSTRPATSRDTETHLQFQISLLRLMAQKSMAQKSMAQKSMAQKSMAQKSINQKPTGRNTAGPNTAPGLNTPVHLGSSIQVEELERLQHSSFAKVPARDGG